MFFISCYKLLASRVKMGKKGMFIGSFFILILCANQVKAQDPEFSQFYANPIYLNPAFTGTSALSRTVMNYRNQWPKQGNTYTTFNLSVDEYVNSIAGGIGFKVMYDRQLNGVINTLNASFIYSKNVNVNDRLFFSMALETGLIYKQFNFSGLIFPGMIDQGNGTITGTYPMPSEGGNKTIPDFSFGTVGQIDEVYFGVALHHLTEPSLAIFKGDQSGKLPLKLTVHAGTKGRGFRRGLFSKEFTLSPNFVYQQQGDFKQINGGMYLNQDWLTLGLWYRNNLSARPNSMIAMLGYQSEGFQFGYSFDFSLSNSASYSYGSHEISLIFFFGESKRQFLNKMMIIPQM